MATNITRLRVDRNAGAFDVPPRTGDPARDLEALTAAVVSFANRVNRCFQRLHVAVEGPDTNPYAPAIVQVVTGISGSNFTTANLTVLGFTNGANVAVGTQVTALTGVSIGTNTLDFTRQTLTVLVATNISNTQLSGTNCPA